MSYSALNCVDMDGLNAPFPTHTNTNPIKNAHSLAMAPYPTAMITAPNTALLCAPKRASDTIPPNTGVRYAKHANVPYALALVASAASNRARIAVASLAFVTDAKSYPLAHRPTARIPNTRSTSKFGSSSVFAMYSANSARAA